MIQFNVCNSELFFSTDQNNTNKFSYYCKRRKIYLFLSHVFNRTVTTLLIFKTLIKHSETIKMVIGFHSFNKYELSLRLIYCGSFTRVVNAFPFFRTKNGNPVNLYHKYCNNNNGRRCGWSIYAEPCK